MLHAHFQVGRGHGDVAQFDARMQPEPQRGLDGLAFGGLDVGVGAVVRLADAHGVVGSAELHHVHAGHREDVFQILDALALFDHHRDDHVVQGLDVVGVADVAVGADVAAHADAHQTAAAWRFRTHRGDAVAGVLDGADIGEQHRLEARADGAQGLVGVLALFDLDHATNAGQLEGAAEIVEVVHGERRVFGGELDVVVLPGGADQLDQRRPHRQDMSAEGRLVGLELLAELVGAHGRPSTSFASRYQRPRALATSRARAAASRAILAHSPV